MALELAATMRKLYIATLGFAATAAATTVSVNAQEAPIHVASTQVGPTQVGNFQVPPLLGPSASLPNHATEIAAADPAGPGFAPTTTEVDLAPVRLPERGSAYGNYQTLRTSVLYKLPAKMFFDANCENSLRLETNIFNTLRDNKADMIYRVNPNVTLGYAINRKTRVSANYFFLRDQYTRNDQVMSRNYQSVGFRADRDFVINPKTSATASIFARELFVPGYRQVSDVIPSVSVVRRVGQRGAIYTNILGQVRWRDVFGRYQEFDQFYSLGGIYRTPKWTFLMDTTCINNFGKRAVRLGPNNTVIVMTLEAGRRVHPMVPVTVFCRAEPIFNIGANQAPGFAGVNFRIFGGIRAEISKPAIFPVKLRKPMT